MAEMNCLSARRIISTDVSDKSADFIGHINSCSSCKSYYEKQLKFNGVLKKAFEIDVPDGLAARVLVEHKLNNKKSNADKFRWGTIAASIVLAFVVSAVSTFHSPPALADAILEHVKYDEAAFEIKNGITLEELNAFLKDNGFDLNTSGGEIKGGRDVFLAQSSTLASVVRVKFTDSENLIPCCYYEFAERFPMSDGKLYSGFVAKSADKIFESTDVQK